MLEAKHKIIMHLTREDWATVISLQGTHATKHKVLYVNDIISLHAHIYNKGKLHRISSILFDNGTEWVITEVERIANTNVYKILEFILVLTPCYIASDLAMLYNHKQTQSFWAELQGTQNNPDLAVTNLWAVSISHRVLNFSPKFEHQPSILKREAHTECIPTRSVER